MSAIPLCNAICLAAAMFATGCYYDSYDDRLQVSQHTKDLAAQVRADPDSEAGQEAMNELKKILNGNWSFAQRRAADALGSLGPLAKPAVPDLMRAANSEDKYLEGAAVCALASLGITAAPAVDLFIAKVEYAVSNDTYSLHPTLDAIRGLGNIGEPALRAIPILERAAKMEHKSVAKEAERALEKIQQ